MPAITAHEGLAFHAAVVTVGSEDCCSSLTLRSREYLRPSREILRMSRHPSELPLETLSVGPELATSGAGGTVCNRVDGFTFPGSERRT